MPSRRTSFGTSTVSGSALPPEASSALRAAMFRAATMSRAFFSCAARLREFAENDECIALHDRHPRWKESAFLSMVNNNDQLSRIPRAPAFGDLRFQHKAEHALLK
eukprot:7667384-Pyramimonas_sp.AAC.1